MIGVQQYIYVYARSTRVQEQQQQEYTEQQQEYKSIGVYAVVQYAMSTVTTRSTRVLVVGVYKSTAVYVAESIAVVCQVSTVVQQQQVTTIQKHNYYYMYVLYINNVSVILHRVSSSIHTVAYLYNCIAVSVSRLRVSQV